MLIWRLFLKAVSSVFDNAFVGLALIVIVLVAINYKTLLQNLPNSVPEIDEIIASVTPGRVRLSGSVSGVNQCWRMNFRFLRTDGSPLPGTASHVGRVTTKRPEAELTLPYRSSYLLRLETEVFLSNPENCLPVASGAILRSKVLETELTPPRAEFSLINACDFSDSNSCQFEIR